MWPIGPMGTSRRGRAEWDGIWQPVQVTPLDALNRTVYLLDRSSADGYRVRAFLRAAEVVRATDPDDLAERARRSRLTQLDGIGEVTARLITEALSGAVPDYLARLERDPPVMLTDEGAVLRQSLRGDLHSHSRWSDGGATIEDMAGAAMALGHEYLVMSDHSARLTVAHGLSRDRLLGQLAEISALNVTLAGRGFAFRVLTGMEVDINENGSLDADDDILAMLDVVVASAHSKLRMPAGPMTERLVAAVANPHVDVLGHCTGRMVVGKGRPPSEFDADTVFAACLRFDKAVEINCRPERLDPPMALLKRAAELGCRFAVDTDAHAPGQLEWQGFGCNRAADARVAPDRIVNSLARSDLLAWAASH